MQSKYDSYSESTGGQDFDSIELIPAVRSMVQGELTKFFGTDNEWGQSVGLTMTNVQLEDGGLYLDPEKGKLKTFSWDGILGVDQFDLLEDGEVLEASEAHERLSKEYAGNNKTYQLVGARVAEVVDDDGETVVPASSTFREFEWFGEGDAEFDGFEDLGGDLVPIHDETITWFGADSEHGASASTSRLIGLLAGPDFRGDMDTHTNFITDTSGDNILREDLQDRTVRFLVTRRTAEESGREYNYPVVEDVKTGEPVQYNYDEDEDESGN